MLIRSSHLVTNIRLSTKSKFERLSTATQGGCSILSVAVLCTDHEEESGRKEDTCLVHVHPYPLLLGLMGFNVLDLFTKLVFRCKTYGPLVA